MKIKASQKKLNQRRKKFKNALLKNRLKKKPKNNQKKKLKDKLSKKLKI